MKKILLILSIILSTTMFYSCSDDSNGDGIEQITEELQVRNVVKSNFYNIGVEAYKFNEKNVDVWTNIENGYQYYDYQSDVSYEIWTDKKYIVIKTTPEIVLNYEIKNGKVYIYDKNDNNMTPSNKPTELKEEAKEKPIETNTILVDGEKQTILKTELSFFGGVTVDRHLTVTLKDEWNVETEFVVTFKNFRNENEFSYSVQSQRNILRPYNQNLYIYSLKYFNAYLSLEEGSEVKVLSANDTKATLSFDLITAEGRLKTLKGNIEVNY